MMSEEGIKQRDPSKTPNSDTTKALFVSLLSFSFAYLALESGFSTLYILGILDNPSFGIIEKRGIRYFDPIQGYRVPPTPARFARLSFGTVEYLTAPRGNAQGFLDRDDFSIQGREPRRLRIAVLGDSFPLRLF